ncbi:relaxase/mobilization nuclease domain-containing protein [Dyadobacter frigoris]|uniref:Relaxase n=1 Tax=Dyadobacter frigoris TaxID=2576211 RepID=A0A4U6CRH4_9BACT|nr:relaxase/mobilization nuclease domain-containing protein [Dyadobacter frigoris]TKT85468.1 relaxase [Dyadobacter frigoris]GLU56255.1 mobilization protein [Dyadobacter frigoris]
MVAVIHQGSSLREAVNYNERKVERQVAVLLDAGYYPKDPEDLTFKQRLARLENRAKLNQRVKVNHFHVSLNFAPGEHIAKEDLKQIAALYLDKIGFANQPYLLYEHNDSGHPHLHVVSTTIRADGSSINLHNIGRNQSSKARREIENQFGLIKADGRKGQSFELKPVNLQKVEYGKSDTKRAISNVLSSVLESYRYTSLPELNAVLKQYNIMADGGMEDSRIYRNQGLVYYALDANGNRAGASIKASDFHFRPTLKFLQNQFAAGETDRLKHRAKLKNSIDLILVRGQGQSLEDLMLSLEKEGVKVVLRKSPTGLVYGITYVDHRTKCVFNGSVLGKEYSAKGILDRIGQKNTALQTTAKKLDKKQSSEASDIKLQESVGSFASFDFNANPESNKSSDPLLEDLFTPLSDDSLTPWQLRKSRRKKRKKNISQ